MKLVWKGKRNQKKLTRSKDCEERAPLETRLGNFENQASLLLEDLKA